MLQVFNKLLVQGFAKGALNIVYCFALARTARQFKRIKAEHMSE